MGSDKKDKSSSKKRRESDAAGTSEKKRQKSSSDAPSDAEPASPVAVYVSPISTPMAGDKLCKKIFKLVSKATKAKTARRGIKEVVKAIRKSQKGICIIAGNVSPIDVISHIPVFCETHEIPYCYVPSKELLGAAANTKRPTSVILVTEKAAADSKEEYAEVMKGLTGLKVTF